MVILGLFVTIMTRMSTLLLNKDKKIPNAVSILTYQMAPNLIFFGHFLQMIVGIETSKKPFLFKQYYTGLGIFSLSIVSFAYRRQLWKFSYYNINVNVESNLTYVEMSFFMLLVFVTKWCEKKFFFLNMQRIIIIIKSYFRVFC